MKQMAKVVLGVAIIVFAFIFIYVSKKEDEE